MRRLTLLFCIIIAADAALASEPIRFALTDHEPRYSLLDRVLPPEIERFFNPLTGQLLPAQLEGDAAVWRFRADLVASVAARGDSWANFASILWISATDLSSLRQELDEIDRDVRKDKHHKVVLRHLLLYPLVRSVPYVPFIQKHIPENVGFNIDVDKDEVALEVVIKWQ